MSCDIYAPITSVIQSATTISPLEHEGSNLANQNTQSRVILTRSFGEWGGGGGGVGVSLYQTHIFDKIYCKNKWNTYSENIPILMKESDIRIFMME